MYNFLLALGVIAAIVFVVGFYVWRRNSPTRGHVSTALRQAFRALGQALITRPKLRDRAYWEVGEVEDSAQEVTEAQGRVDEAQVRLRDALVRLKEAHGRDDEAE